jgi:hypothetical protein
VLAHAVYPDPGLRPMHDVDLLIRSEDVTRCEQVLYSWGVTPVERLRHQLVYHIEGTILEIHWSLLTPRRYRNVIPSSTWLSSRRWIPLPEGRIPALSPENEMISILLHAFLHHDGGRIFPLLDLALVLRQWPLDWEQVIQFAQRAHLCRLFALALRFVDSLFPLDTVVPFDRFDRSEPAAARFFPAYRAQLFREDSLRHYWRRKQSTLYYAEKWGLKLRQCLRFFGGDEFRLLLRQGRKCFSREPAPSPAGPTAPVDSRRDLNWNRHPRP